MRVAIIGGTGDFGKGLALRWGRHANHELVIGSRDPRKAKTAVEEYLEELAARDVNADISGASNVDAAAGAEVVVLSVPPVYVIESTETISGSMRAGTTVVSPAVSLTRDAEGFHYDPPDTGDSITAVVAREPPDDVNVVGAFHNIAAERLADLDTDLDLDTVVIGDDEDAIDTVATLAEDIEGLRAFNGGGFRPPPTSNGSRRYSSISDSTTMRCDTSAFGSFDGRSNSL